MRCMAFFVAGGLALSVVGDAAAQSASGAKCEYMNTKSGEFGSDNCTVGEAGIAIDAQNFKVDGKPDPKPGVLRRIVIEFKSRQGQWSRVSINGRPGTRYETDRCNYAYASDDLQEFVTVKACLAAQESPRPPFMTAGGAWIGKWVDGSQNLCKGDPAEKKEGVFVYTTKKVSAYESMCDVVGIKQVGPGVEVSMTCYGEGMKSKEVETLNVVNGRLGRTVVIDRKRKTFWYDRCD
jgi:hypothetical protein